MELSGPSAAETARTLVAGHAQGYIEVPWETEAVSVSHVSDDLGRIAVFVADGHPLARVACLNSETQAKFVVHDISAIPCADRIRGRIEIHGKLIPVPPHMATPALQRLAMMRGLENIDQLGRLWVLQLDPLAITLTCRDLQMQIDLSEYCQAAPDPLAPNADVVVRHLTNDHPEILATIAHTGGGQRVIATALDRYGLDIEIDSLPTRIPFRQQVNDYTELAKEIHHLRHAACKCAVNTAKRDS